MKVGLFGKPYPAEAQLPEWRLRAVVFSTATMLRRSIVLRPGQWSRWNCRSNAMSTLQQRRLFDFDANPVDHVCPPVSL
jgi:hypothetical protein